MFVLAPDRFGDFNLGNALEFVEYWRKFYRERVSIFQSATRIDYFAEIDPSRPLEVENVRRLLRWKDPRLLTHLIVSGRNAGRDNERVVKITNQMKALNDFRVGVIDEQRFLDWTAAVFPHPSAWVWRVFLAHIARPLDYPIVDRHVLRSYACHTGDAAPLDWPTYKRYRLYFEDLVAASARPGESQLVHRKHVDDALFAFGQFLKSYLVTPSS
jgi:hypothetical protein